MHQEEGQAAGYEQQGNANKGAVEDPCRGNGERGEDGSYQPGCKSCSRSNKVAERRKHVGKYRKWCRYQAKTNKHDYESEASQQPGLQCVAGFGLVKHRFGTVLSLLEQCDGASSGCAVRIQEGLILSGNQADDLGLDLVKGNSDVANSRESGISSKEYSCTVNLRRLPDSRRQLQFLAWAERCISSDFSDNIRCQ